VHTNGAHVWKTVDGAHGETGVRRSADAKRDVGGAIERRDPLRVTGAWLPGA